MGIFQTRKNKKKCRELLDNGTKYLISAQQNILTTSRQNWKLAKETFEEIFEVDPDNKTGYHTHAWYMLGLTYLSFAWLHSHLGANKVAPRAEIPKEKISSYYFTSMGYIGKTVNCLLANPNGLWYRDGQPTKMFLISDIFFPYEPFAEACRDALIIAKRELGWP